MFNTVVWAADGSPSADRALPVAKGIVAHSDGKLVIVHVDETGVGRSAALAPPMGPDAVVVLLKRTVEELRREGIDAELRTAEVMIGGIAKVIADIAQEVGADLIVAGTRGHNPIVGLLVGSVTHRLLEVARCPVLAVPAESGDAG